MGHKIVLGSVSSDIFLEFIQEIIIYYKLENKSNVIFVVDNAQTNF